MIPPSPSAENRAGDPAVPLMDQWYRFAAWTLDRTERFPKSARFTLSSRIDNLVLDGIGLIVEARFGRNRVGNLESINLMLEKLRFFFRLAYERRYLSSGNYESASERIEEAGRMTGGWIRYLRGRKDT